MNSPSSERSWPAAWQVGLSYLVIFYVGTAIASVFVPSVKNAVADVDARVAEINRRSDEALLKRDVENLRLATEELEAQAEVMKTLRIITFGGAAIAVLGYGLLLIGTWKITQQPISPLETAARYASAAPLILVPFLCGGIRTEGMQLLIALAAFVIFFGHLVAGFKVAHRTGSRDIAARIKQNLYAVGTLLVLRLVLNQARGLFGSEAALNTVASIITFALSVTILIQAAALWQLSRRLKAATSGT